MYQRSRPAPSGQDQDQDPGQGERAAFEDRAVRLAVTFQGAGFLTGDLTPECAQLVGTVLEALSAPAGAEDTRTREQRYHDALAEAMTRLAASDLLPERAGQQVRAGRRCWRSGRRGCGRSGRRGGPRLPKVTGRAGRGWMGTQPGRSRATRRWRRW
jgi:Domain of unknown function (DUF222)